MTDTMGISRSVDRSKESDEKRLREKYEPWLERYPPYARQHLQRRLWNDSAWFELLVHELLGRLGCKVDVIDIDNTDKTPDFLGSYGDRNCYVEATTVNPRDNPSILDPNLQDALRKLNELSSSDFQIRLSVEGKIQRTLGKDELVKTFGKLLREHGPVTVQQQIRVMGEFYAPFAELRGKGWRLRGELVPISPEHRLDGKARELIIGPIGTFAGDASPEVQKAVSKKASKYGRLNAPLIVAANVLDIRFDREAELAALFGQEQIQYFPSRPDVPDKLIRKPDGVWIKGGYQPRYTRLAGVIMFNGFFPWSPRGSVCLYLNPFNSNLALPEALYKLPYAKGEGGYIRRTEGADIETLLFENPA